MFLFFLYHTINFESINIRKNFNSPFSIYENVSENFRVSEKEDKNWCSHLTVW